MFEIFSIEVFALAISTVLAVLASGFTKFISERRRHKLEAHIDRIRDDIFKETTPPSSISDERWSAAYEATASAATSATAIIIKEKLDDEAIRNEIETATKELKSRIIEIENRFPDKENIQQVSSFNEAVLFTTIENISKKIDKLEESILTKWDVAVVVFALFAAISAVIGILFIGITLLRSSSVGS